MIRRFFVLVVIGLVVASAVAGAIAYARIPAPVDLERSESIVADIIRRVSVNGVVVPADRENVYAPISLRALEVLAVSGQSVRRGDVLARLDSSSIDLELARREAAVARAHAALRKVTSEPRDVDRLPAEGMVSERALDVRVKTLEMREAELELARVRRLRQACVLIAPIDGEIVTVNVRTGETAHGQGQGPPPFVLAKVDVPTIDVEADEFQAASIRAGQPAFVYVESAVPGRPLIGYVSSNPQLRRAPSAMTGPAAFGLTVKLSDAIDRLRIGVSARVEIETGIARRALAVPVSAVFEFDSNDHVIEALSGGGYSLIRVRTGLSDARFVAIEGSLKKGGAVLVGDPTRLRELARQLSAPRGRSTVPRQGCGSATPSRLRGCMGSLPFCQSRWRAPRSAGTRAIKPIWGTTTERLGDYPLRSVLGALGVAVGAASIVLLTSIVQSAASEATQGLLRLGQNRIFIASAPPAPGKALRRHLLSLDDARAIRRGVPGLSLVTPLATLTATMVACGQRYGVNVKAVSPDHLALEQQRLARGRYITDLDIRTRGSVAIIGQSLWRKIPCLQRPNTFVQIGAHSYEIVGLLDVKGQRWGDDLDETVHIPFSTAELRYMSGGAPVSLIVSVNQGVRVTEAADMIRRALRRRVHGDAEDAGLLVYSQTDLVKEMAGLSDKVSLLIALLLSVGILIAGIGVVNSVMTSVLERTAEIGLRRAVGATRRQIAKQFLCECLIISAGGAIAGVAGGALLGALVSKALAFPIVVNLKMAVLSLTTSTLLGLVCGVWPAFRAANLTPTDALRHE